MLQRPSPKWLMQSTERREPGIIKLQQQALLCNYEVVVCTRLKGVAPSPIKQ